MIQTQEHGTEAWWAETGAEEWADAIVAAMKLGGVDNLFFVSGSELTFYHRHPYRDLAYSASAIIEGD